MLNRSVGFIATSTPAGQELMQAARLLAERLGYSFEGHTTPSQVTSGFLMARDDVAILDATIEPGGGSAYRGFTAQPFLYDHVLVISRSPLPLNFHGSRPGGAPDRLRTFDNSTLIAWLERQLEDLATKPRRTKFQRTLTGATIDLIRQARSDNAVRRSGHHVFVSYRREALDQARDLCARLRSGDIPQLDGPADVTFLEPGEIAFDDEILTGQLRWHMISLLSDRIADCTSMVICDSPNYLGSWWTRIELVLYRYVTYGRSDAGMRLFRYHPADGRIDEPDDIVPAISYEQKTHIDRTILNTGSTMPADTVASQRLLGLLPIFRNFSFFNNPVFGEEFARSLLLDIGSAGPRISTLSDADVRSTIDLRDEKLVRVPSDIVAAAARDGSAVFNGRTLYRDREQGERYLWYPIRMDRPTAPPGSLDDTLVALPIIRAHEPTLNATDNGG